MVMMVDDFLCSVTASPKAKKPTVLTQNPHPEIAEQQLLDGYPAQPVKPVGFVRNPHPEVAEQQLLDGYPAQPVKAAAAKLNI